MLRITLSLLVPILLYLSLYLTPDPHISGGKDSFYRALINDDGIVSACHSNRHIAEMTARILWVLK